MPVILIHWLRVLSLGVPWDHLWFSGRSDQLPDPELSPVRAFSVSLPRSESVVDTYDLLTYCVDDSLLSLHTHQRRRAHVISTVACPVSGRLRYVWDTGFLDRFRDWLRTFANKDVREIPIIRHNGEWRFSPCFV